MLTTAQTAGNLEVSHFPNGLSFHGSNEPARQSPFCHSEQSEESLRERPTGKEGGIPRFARNNKITGAVTGMSERQSAATGKCGAAVQNLDKSGATSFAAPRVSHIIHR